SFGPDGLARLLELFAAAAETRREEIVAMAHRETALPEEPRLRSTEFPRMTDQLRQAAAASRERSWCRATIDTKLNLRSKYGPLDGPVVVFSPNNFPLAFNAVGGGDFAAAVAAGNPVIAKANPGHPGTTRLLAEAAVQALHASGLPPALVQMVYHFEAPDGLRLVSHPLTGATAFTGSRPAGLGLKEAADKAGKPISLELSSINPVFVLPGALAERGGEIAAEMSGSCALGGGQFCTKPGMVVLVDDEHGRSFLETLKRAFESQPPGYLLGEQVLAGMHKSVDALLRARASLVAGGRHVEGPGFRFANTLFRTTGRLFLAAPEVFQVEVFGPFSVVVLVEDFEQMNEVAAKLGGNLTAAVYSARSGEDDALYDRLEPLLRAKVGRLLNDKMPTGVAVSPAMVHGGPFPATGHPGFTSVGIPASLLRFAALYGYDNVRSHRLPAELRDENPTGRMWRLIDGEWTQRSI
ncbi:MAG: aldehyde dehydrogenase family protein, partial [Candidatus Aminicenantes bacterium]|nr:aldehyde dehydrogenase family protein [Candidatus Aminicenantes bacterium]